MNDEEVEESSSVDDKVLYRYFNPLVINRGFMERYGLCGAAVLAYLISAEERTLRKSLGSWFSVFKKELLEEIGLQEDEQEQALHERLEKQGVISFRKEEKEWVVKIKHMELSTQMKLKMSI